MITLISKNNFNLFINEETGKWFSFYTKTQDRIIRDIKEDKINEIFESNKKILGYINELKNSTIIENNKLTKMNYLVLHTSDLCNMKCKYCYAEENICNKKDSLMTSETMIKSILKFYNNENFYVLFHGREPLTNYKNIIETLEYFKEYKKINFILQTNGMLLNDAIINDLIKYNVSINISIDGILDKHNEFRINGLDIDYTNKLKKIISKYKISPIIIVHEKNYKDLDKITDYLLENKIYSASYNFLWPTNDNKYLNKYVVSNKLLFETMKNVFDKSIENNNFIFKERDLYLLYGRILKRDIYNYMCNSAPCGAGKNCISVSKTGQIYPCTMVNSKKECFLGDLSDSIEYILNKENILKERDITKIKDCNKCPLRIFCKGGGCAGFIYNLTNDVNSKSIYCEYYYNIILYIMEKITIMSKEEYFMNY